MNKEKKYFLKQKLMGVLLLLLTALSVVILEGDITVAFFLVPISLALIFSKEKIWMDDYFFETEEDQYEEEEEL